MNAKWDARFLELAEHVGSKWSRDPSTKVGAVIVRPDKTVASMGYNGFPRGVQDDEARYADRQLKYKLVCHAEANAIVSASEKLTGCTVYVSPLFPCQECAKLVIQSGITRVVAPPMNEDRWQESNHMAALMFAEAGVSVDVFDNTSAQPECKHDWYKSPSIGAYICDLCGDTMEGCP